MGLQVLNLSAKYYSQFANGEDFSLDTSNVSTFLIGNVGDKVRCETEFTISWFSQSSVSSPFDIVGAVGQNEITRTSGSFLNDGFAVGDQVIGYTTSGGSSGSPDIFTTRNVTYVDDNLLIVDGAALTSTSYTDMYIYGVSTLTGVIYEYGIIGNNESTNFLSKIDGSLQKYTVSGLTAGSGSPTTATAVGTVQSWVNGQVTVEHLGKSSNDTIQQIRVIHDFIILPYYVDGEVANLSTIVPPTLFNGSGLKHVFQFTARNVVTNNNDNKIALIDQNQGTVNWFNNSLTTNTNIFTVDSINYEDTNTSNSVSGLQADRQTNVEVVITRSSGSFLTSDDTVLFVSALRSATDYAGNSDDFESNFLFESAVAKPSDSAVSGTIITDYDIAVNSTSQITVKFKVEYSAAQTALLTTFDSFLIAFSSDVATMTNATSDRVQLICGVGNYVKSSDVPDLIQIAADSNFMEFFPHYADYYTEQGFSDAKAWVEDGYVFAPGNKLFSLNLNPSTPFTQVTIQSCKFKVAAYNPTTSDFFPIQTYDFDLSQAVLGQNGAGATCQQINVNTTRNYDLLATDQFNMVLFQNEPGGTTANENYRVAVGFKFNWEEWISLPGANAIFYDSSEPNNGLNKDTARYSLNNGFYIVCCYDITVNDGFVSTDYRFRSPLLDVNDYDEDGSSYPRWDCTITLKDQAAANDTNGLILANQNTHVEAVFNRNSLNSVSGLYGVIRLDDENGNEYTIRELSSLLPAKLSELTPESGQTGVKIVDDGTNVTLTCEIDYTKITQGENYKVSARLWALAKEGAIQDDNDDDLIDAGERPILEG